MVALWQWKKSWLRWSELGRAGGSETSKSGVALQEKKDWKRLDPELARCQLESQKAVAAIEKQSWEKVEAALVVEVAATATTGCKAIETIEKNKGKWQQADILAVLGKFLQEFPKFIFQLQFVTLADWLQSEVGSKVLVDRLKAHLGGVDNEEEKRFWQGNAVAAVAVAGGVERPPAVVVAEGENGGPGAMEEEIDDSAGNEDERKTMLARRRPRKRGTEWKSAQSVELGRRRCSWSATGLARSTRFAGSAVVTLVLPLLSGLSLASWMMMTPRSRHTCFVPST